MRFELGQVAATAGAMNALRMDEIVLALALHQRGDSGELCEQDKQANEAALMCGARIRSAYTFRQARVWVITEADRSSTCILLPEEY